MPAFPGFAPVKEFLPPWRNRCTGTARGVGRPQAPSGPAEGPRSGAELSLCVEARSPQLQLGQSRPPLGEAQLRTPPAPSSYPELLPVAALEKNLRPPCPSIALLCCTRCAWTSAHTGPRAHTEVPPRACTCSLLRVPGCTRVCARAPHAQAALCTDTCVVWPPRVCRCVTAGSSAHRAASRYLWSLDGAEPRRLRRCPGAAGLKQCGVADEGVERDVVRKRRMGRKGRYFSTRVR